MAAGGGAASIFVDVLRTGDRCGNVAARWESLFEQVELKIELTEDIRELHRAVKRKVGTPTCQQLLSLPDGTHLSEPSKTLADYGLKDGDRLHLTDYQPLRKSWESDECPCRIPKTEERGISLRQLNELLQFFGSRCLNDGTLAGWTDNYPRSPSFGEPLTLRGINLHQANAWLIKPSSRKYKTSYVELISTDAEAQRPTWFASHCWSEAIYSFVMCVEEHQDRRNRGTDVGDEAAIWVCAYANNQHELGTEIGCDPKDSAFFRAIALCRGVLLILDAEAEPFERIWCCFEESVVISDERKLLDMATVVIGNPRRALMVGDHVEVEKDGVLVPAVVRECIPSKNQYQVQELSREAAFRKVSAKQVKMPDAVVLMDGLTLEEEAMEKKFAGRGWEVKRKREGRFPLSLVKNKGLGINIAEAKASYPIDRVRILNSIAGAAVGDLDKEPPTQNEHYTCINNGLSAMFAIAAWPRAVDTGDEEFCRKVAHAVRADTARKQLSISFAGLQATALEDADLEAVGRSIPPSLESLTFCLGLGNRRCFDSGYNKLWEGIPANLRRLNLDLTKGFNLTDAGLGTLASRLPPTLKELQLSLDNPNGKGLITDRGLEEISDAFRPGLESVSLSLQYLMSVTELGVHHIVAALPDTVSRLSVQLVGTSGRSVLPAREQGGQLEAARKLQGPLREGMPLKYAPAEKLGAPQHVATAARACPRALLTAAKAVRDDLCLVLTGVLAASVAQPVHVQVGAICMAMSCKLREELRLKLQAERRADEAAVLRTWDLRESPRHGVVKVLPRPPPGVYEDRSGGTWRLSEDGQVLHTEGTCRLSADGKALPEETVYLLREEENSTGPVRICCSLVTEGIHGYAKYNQHPMTGGQYLFKDYSGKECVYWKPADSIFKNVLDFFCEQADVDSAELSSCCPGPRPGAAGEAPCRGAFTPRMRDAGQAESRISSKAGKRLSMALQSAELLMTSAEEESLDLRFLEAFGVLAQPLEVQEKGGKDAVSKAIGMFEEFDTSCDGAVSEEELLVGLRRLDPNITDAEVHKLLTTIDVHGDGTITMKEFIEWLSAAGGAGEQAAEGLQQAESEHMLAMFGAGKISEDARDAIQRVVRIFQSVDVDGDGCVSAAELQRVASVAGVMAPTIPSRADSDGDGTVSFAELMEFRYHPKEGVDAQDEEREGEEKDSCIALAASGVRALTNGHLTEMRSYVTAPPSVKTICEALCSLLGHRPPSYETANRELLSKRARLVEEISAFDPSNVPQWAVREVKARDLDSAMSKGSKKNSAEMVLCRWVVAAMESLEQFKALPQQEQERRRTITRKGHVEAVRQDAPGAAPPKVAPAEPPAYCTLSAAQRRHFDKSLGIFIDHMDGKLNHIHQTKKMIPVVFGSASVCQAMHELCGKEKSWEMLDCTRINNMSRKKQALEDIRASIIRALVEGLTLCVFVGTPSGGPNLKRVVKCEENKAFLPQAVFIHGGLQSKLVQKHLFQDGASMPAGGGKSVRVCVLAQYESGCYRMNRLETELMEDHIPLFSQMESFRCFTNGDLEEAIGGS